MPGSDLLYSTNPESFDSTPASIRQKTEVVAQTPNKPITLSTHTPQNFMEVKKHEMFGPRISRREQRKFNNYLFSPKGMQDAVAFNKAEQLKAQAASDYVASRNTSALKSPMPSMVSDAQKQTALNVINQPMKAHIPKPEVKPEQKPVNTAYWNSQANKFGFNNMDEVKAWQQQNGLVADGMFGKNSEAKWRSMQQQASNPKLVSRTITTVDGTPMDSVKRSTGVPNSNTLVVPQSNESQSQETIKFNLNNFARANGLKVTRQFGQDLVRWDPDGFGDFWIDSSGNIYEGGTLFDNTRKVNIKSGLGYGERKARYEALQNAIQGFDGATNTYGIKISEKPKQIKSSYYTPTMSTYRNFYKQGGTMNRINYFQQGGAAPQKDIKAQVTALVQAAMQGDQKATQQVNQIMEAAKAGDQQAMQIAQIMEQVIKELQGQATAAKWGAKLGYIKSLKYAKGGKTCPACEKKVEMKACGGKKAKKRYFGGLI